MTKSDLIKALEPYPDDTPIIVSDHDYVYRDIEGLEKSEDRFLVIAGMTDYWKSGPVPVVIE